MSAQNHHVARWQSSPPQTLHSRRLWISNLTCFRTIWNQYSCPQEVPPKKFVRMAHPILLPDLHNAAIHLHSIVVLLPVGRRNLYKLSQQLRLTLYSPTFSVELPSVQWASWVEHDL